MVDDETIRLKFAHWPPEYQGAVIAYARMGTVAKAAKEAGIARPTLSKHINHGLKGAFSPEEWCEVVSLLQYRETVFSPPKLAAWVHHQMLEAKTKSDYSSMEDGLSVRLVEALIDLITKMAAIEASKDARGSRARVTVEAETVGGDIPRDIIDGAMAELKERFGQARYATDPAHTPDDGGTGGSPEDPLSDGGEDQPVG